MIVKYFMLTAGNKFCLLSCFMFKGQKSIQIVYFLIIVIIFNQSMLIVESFELVPGPV